MSAWAYLRDLTSVFFNWWWVVVTGIASLLPFFGFLGPNIIVSNTAASVVILLAFCLLFLGLFRATISSHRRGPHPNRETA